MVDGTSLLLAGATVVAGVLLVRLVAASLVALIRLALATVRLVLSGVVYLAARLVFATFGGARALALRIRF